jgi:hypothetical protein
MKHGHTVSFTHSSSLRVVLPCSARARTATPWLPILLLARLWQLQCHSRSQQLVSHSPQLCESSVALQRLGKGRYSLDENFVVAQAVRLAL